LPHAAAFALANAVQAKEDRNIIFDLASDPPISPSPIIVTFMFNFFQKKSPGISGTFSKICLSVTIPYWLIPLSEPK
jgi:hypothetical protein